jgi:hypothetical protein
VKRLAGRRQVNLDPKLLSGAVGATVIVGIGAMAIIEDQRERELIAGGHCQKVMEALYTPPPRAQSSCSGDGSSQNCSTWYSQSDSYMRSLWRCADPSREGQGVEFWRPTAEEFGK